MRTSMIALSLAALICGHASAQGWVEYVDRSQRFLVNFPGEPTVRDVLYETELGNQMPARVYTVDKPPSHYSLTVVDYTQAPRIYKELCAREGAECDGFEVGTEVRGAIAFAAWNYRKRGGEITYDAYAQVDGVPGHQLQIKNADGSRTFVAIHQHERRLYILEGTVPESAPPPGLFQQSLAILDEEGHRIRYRYDENDNPVRVEGVDDYAAGQ